MAQLQLSDVIIPGSKKAKAMHKLNANAYARCLLLLLSGACSSAQSASSPAVVLDAKPTASFDVISIRPASSDEGSLGTVELTADEYHAVGEPLWISIMKAYYPSAFWDEQRLVGAPAWVMKDRFTIKAKVGPENLKAWQIERFEWSSLAEHQLLEQMLQSALADRCGLIVHRVPSTISGFALVLDKPDSKRLTLQQAKAERKIPGSAIPIAKGAMMIPTMPDPFGETGLTFFQTSMAALAAQLSNYGAPVIDQTGVSGEYDFFLRQAHEGGDVDGDWDTRSLGLMLKRVSIPMDKIVVDRIERPSPN